MNPEVFLQMVFVLEGLATLCAFELAVASPLVEQLVLKGTRKKIKIHIKTCTTTPQG
jgi:hypothetical protein